jgi:hypothetical protein
LNGHPLQGFQIARLAGSDGLDVLVSKTSGPSVGFFPRRGFFGSRE